MHRLVEPLRSSSSICYGKTLRTGISCPIFRSYHHSTKRAALNQPATIAYAPAAAAITKQQGSSRWHYIATAIRYVRIPVLIVSVYALGYQQGVIDCTKEPEALQHQILNGILVSTGCKNPDDVKTVSEKDIRWHSTARHHQVAAVGQKIVSAARAHVEEELALAMEAVKAKNASEPLELAAMGADATVQFWCHARLRLDGEAVDSQPWRYTFIESPAPNAFVTKILPRRFFITTAMLAVAETPDELAVVLGHEIAHLLLGHMSNANYIETALHTVEVLLLSMDPTAGLLSVFVIGLIYAARRAVSAAFSRENELQADDLGLKLAASACYDTAAGSKVMYKMHHAALGVPPPPPDAAAPTTTSTPAATAAAAAAGAAVPTLRGGNVVGRVMDTHPPSLDRWERMQHRAAEGENYRKYEQCAGLSSRLFNALWAAGSGGKDKERK